MTANAELIARLPMEKRTYHPDPAINAEVAADVLAAETADLLAGYPPRHWICDCGASHARGHFMSIGVHRCMNCGYVGAGGIMVDEQEFAALRARASAPEAGGRG